MKHTRTFVVAALSLMLSAGLAAHAAQGTTGKTTTQTKPTPKPSAPAVTRTAIQVSDLPVAASATISKAYANSTITKATKLTKGSVITYEVAVKQAAKVTNVVVNNDGTQIISPKPKGK
jgi:hypothetical protein